MAMPTPAEVAERAEEEIARLNAEIERLREAMRHAISRMSDLEYHYHGDNFWGPVGPYTAGGERSVFDALEQEVSPDGRS